MDDYERIIRAIVEGQIKGFLKEHPEVVKAVDWYKPRADKTTTFVNSLAKRIVRDLCSPHSRQRVEAALAGMSSAGGGGSGTATGASTELGTSAESVVGGQ